MKKYFIIDEAPGVISTYSFNTEKEAINIADYLFSHFTKYDIKQRYSFYVGLFDLDEEGNPDLSLGGDVIKEYI